MSNHEIPELSALNFFPESLDYASLKNAAEGCKGCELYNNATQTVFGAGGLTAELMFIGEQPGDEEDLAGLPFVGPAGRLFDKALEEAGIDRSVAYVTNTVKHFKWKPQGKRRLHERPNAREVEACLPWLAAEMDVIAPRILVLLGATAAQALLGKQFRVTKERGVWLDSPMAERVLATVHPSSILRAPDPQEREVQYAEFVQDLRTVAADLNLGAQTRA
ncbi:MAG: UdgX family uracil-DNA binding protein [Acidobacteria bacterium]|nr:UdgX family uracil-DNA binding protein [Acidobacteriota bacterium]